ncbi:amino acid permease [Mycobacterium sp. CBMA293]|uniref:amino acid permease n=2 Tax=Mycolicibacterium TaxID=1866885 RepID=UPI0013530EFC|nr:MULTISPECIES: amino acid permease [unclassified Mycolicibacterium]MUL96570.1 amino acid permease [Mycolicibacterium sp. CBMA 230]MUL62126.1 amino acid permease [Mycolicibacterium sp. CBMA 335]MUL73401.1 amino acid permease [Mycolicibacterium sp. CBMA 311]MUM08535.1 proline-specific permease ProY [Mycolicibacterium sp. CBMA 213]MUM14668.1 amino acid permease [Mycolicibacterium sp. CBMA 293]
MQDAETEVAETPDAGYQRGLSARTVQMIAIGGAIGTGLFYGAGGAIEKAGPALILAYLVAGLAVFVIMRALGELLVYRPVSGSISEYAEEFMGRFAGFANGWTYWAVWATTCMAEITVAGKYVQYWPWGHTIPQWVTALVVLIVLFVANLISVKVFGEAEFWFSMIKVTAIIGMILIGIGVLLPFTGMAPGPGSSVSNLWNDGGFFPTGFSSALLSLQIVVFAYVGVELVGVTAGEADNPKVTLRKAINTLPFRIGLFYVGALLVILSVQGWRHYHAGQSPFVAVFQYLNIPAAAGIVNFILLTAALSSCNSGIYSTGRMVRSLAQRGDAPSGLQNLSSRHVPMLAICFSALTMGVGVLVNYLSPDKAFAYITSVSTIGIIFVWGSILVSHLVYRKRVAEGVLPASDYRLPGAPYTTVLALAFLALVVVLLFFSDDGRTAILVGAIWFVIVSLGYFVHRGDRATEVVVRH